MGKAGSKNMVASKSMINKTKTIFCAAMIVCSAMPAFAQRTYFEESFRNYCDKAPSVVEDNGMCVNNEPIWDWAYGAKLCVRAERNRLVYKDPRPDRGLVSNRFV